MNPRRHPCRHPRRLLLATVSLLLSFAPAAAFAGTGEAPGAAPPPPPVTQGMAQPALWKVSDADTTIWLFGTIHILPAGITWYAGPIARALEGSDTLVTEIVQSDDPESVAQIAKLGRSDPPRNLREQLSPEDRKAYEAALASLQLPPAALDLSDPWFAAVMLSTLPLMKDGFGTMNGAEALLVAKAKAKGMPNIGLETAEMQLGLFDSLPPQTQVAYLHEVLESFPQISTEVRAMVEAWKAGDADTLARLMNEDESDPLLMKVLLVDRNKAWAKWIEDRLKQPGTVFVAVGAGHLAGKESVQAQLASARITTQRVR